MGRKASSDVENRQALHYQILNDALCSHGPRVLHFYATGDTSQVVSVNFLPSERPAAIAPQQNNDTSGKLTLN